jgi:hypothetical protein
MAAPRRRSALCAVLLVGLAFATVIQNWSDNQSSHYDLIRALDAGRTTIDSGPYPTKDKACYPNPTKDKTCPPPGRYYSARAPGLAIYALPFYELLKAVDAPAAARASKALRGQDEMIYFVGLWGSVLPGLVLLLLVWRVAERFEPGYGGASAVIVGLGTMILPFSTLLFSHVFAAMLAFAAFALMVHERAGPPRPMLLAAAGLLAGYGITSEYPVAFAAAVLGCYLLSRPGALAPRALASRAGAYVLGVIVGIIPLLLYNHAAFNSWTHLAYADVPRQQKGFFGIGVPSLHVLATLLFDSRGLFTLSPVLLLGAIGTVMIYRRGRRAEALCIGAICACYLGYNSGYYLPFGGGAPGPRFLITALPFLGFPIALALKRFPGPTIALAAVSIVAAVLATLTHPLVGYENETVIWGKLLLGNCHVAAGAPAIVGCQSEPFQPTIASAFGLGRSWGAIWPFVLAAGGALVFAARASAPGRLGSRALVHGALAIAAWGLFAALAPTLLGIDHRGLESIVGAGDHTALNLTLHDGSRYPLQTLVPIAAAAGLAALATARLWRGAVAPASAARS